MMKEMNHKMFNPSIYLFCIYLKGQVMAQQLLFLVSFPSRHNELRPSNHCVLKWNHTTCFCLLHIYMSCSYLLDLFHFNVLSEPDNPESLARRKTKRLGKQNHSTEESIKITNLNESHWKTQRIRVQNLTWQTNLPVLWQTGKQGGKTVCARYD